MEITVRDVLNYFGYRRIQGNDESLNRIITETDINRPGMELMGNFNASTNRIIVLGEKEITFIKTINDNDQRRIFNFLTRDGVPMILISRDLSCPGILSEIAYNKNFPVFSSYAPTSSLIVELISFLEERLAEREAMHGVLMNIYGRGVLITGESGLGKSEISVDLIKRGHTLISDDRVDVYRAHNHLYGEAPELLKGMIELRGVGVVNVEKVFGSLAVDDSTRIEGIIYLKRVNDDEVFDRLGIENSEKEIIQGVSIPKMTLPVSAGRSIASIIETAVASIIQLQRGYNATEDFNNRVRKKILSENNQ